jgi:hypothetical protein
MRRQRAVILRLVSGLLLLWPGAAQAAADTRPLASTQPCVSQQALKDHVYYLAQPVMKGRQPRTIGSQRARQYIMDCFEACGLHPWAGQDSYELPFDEGTNVVAVLPGTDPRLRDKYILVTAHYDHLGIHEGKVYPGATDNASGVAAVLEIARQTSQQDPGPRRSMAFAAFDCEERGLLGARAFSRRPDFQRRSIAAVVNIDMLGHEPADESGRIMLTLSPYNVPRIMRLLQQAAAREGIHLASMVPMGMGSDHAVFRDLHIPCLVFSCGVFADLHQPGDTPDKLNYLNMKHDVAVILAVVRTLADRPEAPTVGTRPAASRPAASQPGMAEPAPL